MGARLKSAISGANHSREGPLPSRLPGGLKPACGCADPWRSFKICPDIATQSWPAVEPKTAPARGRKVSMRDEARASSGLDPARGAPWRRPRGRRWPRFTAERTDRPAYAALDLGTNNCRLLVARPTREGFRVIDAFSRIIRLGEGVLASGRLSEPAIARALEALAVCRDKMRNRNVTRARLIATEACRAAENGPAFLARVTGEVGLELEVLDRLVVMDYDARVANPCIGSERADLVLAGCAILEAIRRAFPCRRLRVADRGLREGILVQLMREDGVWGSEPVSEGGKQPRFTST